MTEKGNDQMQGAEDRHADHADGGPERGLGKQLLRPDGFAGELGLFAQLAEEDQRNEQKQRGEQHAARLNF